MSTAGTALQTVSVYIVLSRLPDGMARLDPLDSHGNWSGEPSTVSMATLSATIARLEAGSAPETAHPRWVWDATSRWYPPLLAGGVRVERCVDLRLSHAILRRSQLTATSALATSETSAWDHASQGFVEGPSGPGAGPGTDRHEAERPSQSALFDLDVEPNTAGIAGTPGAAHTAATNAQAQDSLAEFLLQRDAIRSSSEPNRIGLLLAAESAGALIAAEMQFAGLPWRADIHDQILTELLGPRASPGERPALLDGVLQNVRDALGAPDLNPDSPADLLKALGKAGLMAKSTRSWELKKLDHPAIEPLLEYKKLSRLLSTNGWNWLDSWVQDGRFHPDYIVGGVVTGRWATQGGGALQLSKQVRGAVVADAGWKLVVADASQLEPRILAAMSSDRRMAEAGRSTDMYAAIVDSGAVATRAQAKVAMLGAMYGATTGESGRLMPKLTKAYPEAIGMVEAAARSGERGEIVTTRLGRSSPLPGASWREVQGAAYSEAATDADRSRARGQARSWGRFTRNFIVQGSAAEWALCWMANLRRSLHELSGDAWLTDSPHLVFFLHDEVVVHCPAGFVDAVANLLRVAAAEAGRLLFGDLPVEFPVSVAIVDDYGQAK